MSGILEGIRIIDVSRILAGPYATQMLADLGAEVIKVEAPWGDDTRNWGPPFTTGFDGKQVAAYFLSCNRGKEIVTIDLKRDANEVLELIKTADVVVENFRPGTLKRLLGDLPEDVIICSISAYGATGPRRDEPGYDVALQARSGIMGITGEAGGAPVKVGVAWIDVITGLNAGNAILAALFHKQKTGECMHIDLSLWDSAIAALVNQAHNALASGKNPKPMGSAHPLNAPYQTFRTREGWINVGAANQRNWERLLEVLGVTEMGSDPRFEDNHGRMDNLKQLEEELNKVFETRTTKEWLERLAEVGVPSGPVLDIQEMHRHPQTQARQMVTEVNHPEEGKVETIGLPIKLSETPGGVQRPSPLYGEHTREVLLESGYDEDKVSSFENSGSIFCHDG